MRSRLLCTLSLLVSYNSNGHLIENVYPLLEYIIKKNHIVEFDNVKIHDLFAVDFDLTLPIHVIEYISAQYHEQGFLQEIDGKLIFNKAKLPQRDIVNEIDEKIAEFKKDFTNLFQLYAEFLKEYSPNMTCDSEEEFEHIVNTNIYLMFKTAYMVEPKDISRLDTINSSDSNFCYSQFLLHLYYDSKQNFDRLIDLGVGYVQSEMLVSAALDHDLDLSEATFYLDTRIVLDILGAHGELYYKSSMQCIESLKKKGASIAVFNHTYNEVFEILKSCYKHWHDYVPGLASYALQNFKRENISPYKLLFLYMNLDTRIKDELGLSIVQSPSISEKYLKLGDTLFTEIITIRKGWGFQLYDESSEKDATSIIAVMILRKSEVSKRLEDSKHLFLTSSVSLLKAVNNIFRIKNTEVNYCSSMQYISTLMWLTNASELTSNARLNAAAIAASVRPYNKQFMDKFIESFRELSEIQGLKDEEINALLQNHSLIELMEIQTCGNPVNVTAEATAKTLERYHNRVKSDEIAKQEALQQKINGIVNGVNDTISSKLGKIEGLVSQVDDKKSTLHRKATRISIGIDFIANGIIVVAGNWLLKSVVFKIFDNLPGGNMFYHIVLSIFLCLFLYFVKRINTHKVQIYMYNSYVNRSRYISERESKISEYKEEINDLIKALPTQ